MFFIFESYNYQKERGEDIGEELPFKDEIQRSYTMIADLNKDLNAIWHQLDDFKDGRIWQLCDLVIDYAHDEAYLVRKKFKKGIDTCVIDEYNDRTSFTLFPDDFEGYINWALFERFYQKMEFSDKNVQIYKRSHC